MAKLPKIIRNTQKGQMKRLQDGGTATDDSVFDNTFMLSNRLL